MNLSVNSIVIILINNKSIQVMNEVDIKTSIRIYLGPVYDKDNSAMENVNERVNLKKFESLMENFHSVFGVLVWLKIKSKILIF